MNKKNSISDIRTQYSQKKLLKTEALSNAIDQFEQWWSEALKAELTEVNAMTLATAFPDGTPDARIVLLKDFSKQGFTFFTNYESRKGQELAQNPKACLGFFWKELERQVRISGIVSKITKEESETYFFSRPLGSQIGAVVSNQSSVIQSREELEAKVKAIEIESQTSANFKIEKPDYWGGYLVKPVTIEFWQGRPNRLHDRLRYTLQPEESWKIERLAP